MSITFAIGNLIEVSIAKMGLNVDTAKLPESIVADLFVYGLQQKLADAGASFKDDPDGKMNAARELLNRLYAGEWGKRRESAPTMSNVEKLARQLCTKLVAAKLKVTGKPDDSQVKAIAAGVDKNWEKFRAQAEKILAERHAAQSVEIEM